jgi:CubicO group peptidase (beta-lactamase class C family)
VEALGLTANWPVPHVAAAAVTADGSIHTVGDVDRSFRLASITKLLTGWAVLVACEEGIVDLEQPVGQSGCTLRHLLAHAGGYAFDGAAPIAVPGQRRIYSNTGIELAADAVAQAAEMPFEQYLREAVLEPLHMRGTQLLGSPAHGVRSTVNDLLRFIGEVRVPSLVSAGSATDFHTVQFPDLAGIVPGVGRFQPCPWGLGTEIRGHKQPHWTGTQNSPSTYGHFGGAGTFLWVDPGADVAVIALTDRRFDDWSAQALVQWPALADAVLTEGSNA